MSISNAVDKTLAIQILDKNGKILLEEQCEMVEGEAKFDIAKIPNGNFTIQITNNNNMVEEKITINR